MEATPVHDDDAEAQLVDSGDPSTVAVHRESQLPGGGPDAGASDTVPSAASLSGPGAKDAGVGGSAGAAGTDAAGDTSQSKEAAVHAADGTAASVASSKQKKNMHATENSAERQGATSKQKKAVAADRVSGEPLAEFATTTKTADDNAPATKKVASTADVHKATALRRKGKSGAPKSGAAAEQKLHGGKPDKHDVTEVSGTAVKGADVVAQPSSASESSASRVSRTGARAPPTSDSAASQAATQLPPGVRTGTNVPAASVTSSSTLPPPREEEEALREERYEARFREIVRRTWRRSTTIFCVLLVLATAIASVAFKTSEQRSHLFMVLDPDRFTAPPAAGNASEPPPLSLGNETIISEPKPGQLLLDGIRRQRHFRDGRD